MKRVICCPYQATDNLGYANCLHSDSTVGLCCLENCYRKVWFQRQILNYAAHSGLKIFVKGLIEKIMMEGLNYDR